MSLQDSLKNIHIVLAIETSNGQAQFADISTPHFFKMSDGPEISFFWESPEIPTVPSQIGRPGKDMSFPPPGGSKFGLVRIPPKYASRVGESRKQSHGPAEIRDVAEMKLLADEPGMHKSKSIDYEVVIFGKIDIILPGGQRRTLVPGSCLMMGGAMHAWENPYDEPCVYAAITIGANADW